MKIFVTGATGYLGGAAAQALRRAGHEVFGLCRSQESARALACDEIRPVRGDLTQPEGWLESAAACSVLVHAAADAVRGVVEPDAAALAALLSLAARGPRPKQLVYTSGVWVHGHTGAAPADETTPLAPARLVAWRPGHEQRVLQARELLGLVLRPGCVYGRRGGLTGAWFAQAERGEPVSVVGDGRNRWAMVHVDDLADAYVRAVESGLGGEVFEITDRSRSTVVEMAAAAARVAGREGAVRHVPLEQAREAMGEVADCLALDQHVEARKAVRRLGWQPRHGGFLDGVETYFEAWRAHPPA